mmetsp:Transcript_3719/g.14125  ORF Transcript_3719/g.14125 Transcript_3719/m.14125 type:complete len:416 (+) Transcript_3719:5353-6600(+)
MCFSSLTRPQHNTTLHLIISLHLVPQEVSSQSILQASFSQILRIHLFISMTKQKVTIIGSGNWGSSISKIIAKNTADHSDIFEKQVDMWVFEEKINGRNLTEIINEDHENVKYLPGIKLPDNVRAEPDLAKAIKGATIMVFVIPHQFLDRQLQTIRQILEKEQNVQNFVACSLIKGISIDKTNGPVLISHTIEKALAPWCTECTALMGANIATDVAHEDFCESTLGYKKCDKQVEILRRMFHTPTFQIQVVKEVAGVEICGAVKNVIALASGLSAGLDFGESTRAALIRIGFQEMRKFIQMFYPDSSNDIYFMSCGLADVIATCFGGRNYKVSKAWTQQFKEKKEDKKSWQQLETEMLAGQKLQGTITVEEIMGVLNGRNCQKDFPLFTAIYEIFYENADPKEIFNRLKSSSSKM